MVRLGCGLRGTMAFARSAGTIEMGGKGWRGGFFRKTRRERGADRLRSVTSEQRSDCGRSCSQHNRSNSIVLAQKALGRIGFRAAREWVWCSPPRRATAKVPLPPKVRLGCDALRKAKQSGLFAKTAQSVGARTGPRSLSQDLQIVGLNVNTSCIKQVGGSLGTQRTVRVALPCYLLGRDRSPSGPVLWRACSTVFHACGPGAFGEIAPPRRFLGEVGFSATQMLSEDFRGRDRSPSGPVL